MFSLPDLFLVGTALDLIGGYLIARGLLTSLPVLAVRAGTFWGGNPTVAVGAVEDRADGLIGLVTLAVGFTLQASGYLIEIGWAPGAGASVGRALAGIGVSAVVAAIAVLVWRRARQWLVRRDLLALARFDVKDVRVPPLRMEQPDRGELASLGRAWRGYIAGETDEETVARIFGAVETRWVPPA